MGQYRSWGSSTWFILFSMIMQGFGLRRIFDGVVSHAIHGLKIGENTMTNIQQSSGLFSRISLTFACLLLTWPAPGPTTLLSIQCLDSRRWRVNFRGLGLCQHTSHEIKIWELYSELHGSVSKGCRDWISVINPVAVNRYSSI